MNIDEANKKSSYIAKKRMAIIKSFLKDQPMQKVNKTIFLQFCDSVFNVSQKTIENDILYLERMGYIKTETVTVITYIPPRYDPILNESEKKIKEIFEEAKLKKEMTYDPNEEQKPSQDSIYSEQLDSPHERGDDKEQGQY